MKVTCHLLGLALLSTSRSTVTAFVAPASVRTTSSSWSSQSLPKPEAAWCPTPTESSTTTTSSPAMTTTTSLQALPLPAALVALPLSQKIALSCFLPTCLGFWRSEYGVSYAYGSATALTSFWIYQALIQPAALLKNPSSLVPLATWHAGALMFYGIRLCSFLLYRELFTQKMKDSVKRIEAKATARGSRLKRTPFVLSCAGLYFGLCAPLLLTSQLLVGGTAPVLTQQPWIATAMKALVAMTWGGFIVAALGDFQKSIIKAIKGEDHMVTGGIYAFCRHPNYTGEIVGWTSNGIMALVTAGVLMTRTTSIVPKFVGYAAASVVGALGLDFVLVQATGGLEKRQKETYGASKEYQSWLESSWPGFMTPTKLDEVVDPPVQPEIEVIDTPDEGGSGI